MKKPVELLGEKKETLLNLGVRSLVGLKKIELDKD